MSHLHGQAQHWRKLANSKCLQVNAIRWFVFLSSSNWLLEFAENSFGRYVQSVGAVECVPVALAERANLADLPSDCSKTANVTNSSPPFHLNSYGHRETSLAISNWMPVKCSRCPHGLATYSLKSVWRTKSHDSRLLIHCRTRLAVHRNS